ncbi:MAG: response regulator, partial [Nitrospinae bacterium]|nr:response regulator [Nitrospinota bacterium]
IENCGQHLLDLINDLLDMAKIDAGAMDLLLEECLPGDGLDQALGMMKTQLSKKGHKLVTYIDPKVGTVTCDCKKVKQILLNLLSNAIKYTPENGEIEVKIIKVERHVKFIVSDTGVGIPEADQKKIFDEFYQVDRMRDEALRGTGIGLALTRRFVELHGGDIGVESEPGKGSTFWFTLPDKKSLEMKTKTEGGKSDTLKKKSKSKRILIAEDNPVNLAMILDMLSIHGYDVLVAKNGKEALDLAQSSKPDLILLDIRMPVMDGLEATRKLRSMPEFVDIPIIALTASAGEKSRDKCLREGFTDHLSKPIQSDELFAVLNLYLRK